MAQKKRKSTTKKSTAKHSTQRRGKRAEAAANQARRQAAAVVLFAVAIALLGIIFVPGKSWWDGLHTLFMGLFGIATYVLPLLLGYIAVALAMEKTDTLRVRPWHIVTFTALLGTLIQVFRHDVTLTFGEAVKTAYVDGVANRGTGAVGGIIAYAFAALGTGAAKFILFLLMFVFLMLTTGTSLITLFKAVWKPVEKTRETLEVAVETAMENGEERRRRKAEIDVELDGEHEEKTVEEPAVQSDTTTVDEKLAALQKVMDEVADDEEETPVVVPPETESDEPETPEADAANTIETDQAESEPEKAEPAAKAETYCFPPISLLNESKSQDDSAAAREQAATAELLTQTLREFGVSAKVLDISRGPTVTRYELQPSAGVKISRITGLADDIALRLATTGVRIEAPIPNKAAVGFEVPNRVTSSVCLRDLIGSRDFANAESKLTVALGKDIAGQIVLADLAKMPHLLIAGTTGSGKSVCTNSMIQSVLFHARPDEVRLLLIDPKQVEFGIYNGIPHLLVPVVTDPRKAAGALGWAVNEMLRRYKMFSEANVRDMTSYNESVKDDETKERLPQILIIIDELADLMMVAKSAVESNICRLAQMARAAGMHLVIATQRPSVDVITGLIKANIPSRLALTVASAVDSRTILDTGGAEKLLGKGDMLFMPVGFSKPMRVQGCFVGNREVESVVDFLKSTSATAQYDEAIEQEIIRQAQAAEQSDSNARAGGDSDGAPSDGGDEMLPQAIEVVVEAGMASTSLLQRRLRLGYARAGRIIDEMEQRGIVGPHEGSKPRQVLINRQQWLEMNMTRPDDATD